MQGVCSRRENAAAWKLSVSTMLAPAIRESHCAGVTPFASGYADWRADSVRGMTRTPRPVFCRICSTCVQYAGLSARKKHRISLPIGMSPPMSSSHFSRGRSITGSGMTAGFLPMSALRSAAPSSSRTEMAANPLINAAILRPFALSVIVDTPSDGA